MLNARNVARRPTSGGELHGRLTACLRSSLHRLPSSVSGVYMDLGMMSFGGDERCNGIDSGPSLPDVGTGYVLFVS